MKKVIISVIALAMSLALITAVVIPVLNHARQTGNSSYQKGKLISPFVEHILNK